MFRPQCFIFPKLRIMLYSVNMQTIPVNCKINGQIYVTFIHRDFFNFILIFLCRAVFLGKLLLTIQLVLQCIFQFYIQFINFILMSLHILWETSATARANISVNCKALSEVDRGVQRLLVEERGLYLNEMLSQIRNFQVIRTIILNKG